MRFRTAAVVAVATAMIGALNTMCQAEVSERPEWVLVLHGGAGSLPPDLPGEVRTAYQTGVEQAMERGIALLRQGKPAIDVVVGVVVAMEDAPVFNAGKGSVFTAAGGHELDAAVMDGRTMQTGAVAGVARVKNPVRAARLVMDRTPHVLLAGEGADAFALAAGCEEVPPAYFFSARRFAGLNKYLVEHGRAPLSGPAYDLPEGVTMGEEPADQPGNTVGCVVLDAAGHLAAATSTGGMTGKMHGRVGDTPVVGAGTYANQHCGVSGTGVGEQYLRHTLAARVAWLVEQGQSPEAAVRHCLHEILEPGDGGLIAIDAEGRVTAQTNTGSMPHAIADASGRREVGIWVEGE